MCVLCFLRSFKEVDPQLHLLALPAKSKCFQQTNKNTEESYRLIKRPVVFQEADLYSLKGKPRKGDGLNSLVFFGETFFLVVTMRLALESPFHHAFYR